jgi:CRP-like cAMP-binding protein
MCNGMLPHLALPAARAFLASNGWLAACAPDFVEALLAAGRLRHLQPGEPTHVAGDSQGGIWGLVTGTAQSSTGVAGPETSLTMVFGPGEWGGLGPVSGFRRQLNIEARGSVALVSVPEASLRRLLDLCPGWWAEINRMNFALMVKIGLLAADLQTVDSRRRVAGLLLNAGGLRLAGAMPVTLAMSQEEVGRMANLSRYPTGQILRGFAKAGLVRCGYGRIRIEQPAVLRAIAEGDG